MAYSALILFLAVVGIHGHNYGPQPPQCGGTNLDTCEKVEKVIELIEDITCHGGGQDVNSEGSYSQGGPVRNALGEIVRLARNVIVGMPFENFEDCLSEKYDTSYLCDDIPTVCDPYSYPSFDGTCNNLGHPLWGSVGDSQIRILDPVYDGEYYKARLLDKNNVPLPNPRKISTMVLNQIDDDADEDDLFTMWVWAFGQLADHDIGFSPIIKDKQGNNIDCCGKEPHECPIACMPIPIPDDDPYFDLSKQSCINFVRSVSTPCCSENCPRNPINMISAYMDANPTYGNSDEEAKNFRENNGTGAKLRVNDYYNEGTYLPKNPNQNTACIDSGTMSGSDMPQCMISGDARMHVVPSLTAVISLFNREHNRIVDRLKELNNPGWDDEKLYQEARKIVRAEYQMFTFRDLVAGTILNDDLADEYKLNEKPGYDNIYDSTINTQMAVAFSTAAYRFGHSLINRFHGQFDRTNTNATIDEPIHMQFDRAKMCFMKDGPSGVMRYLSQKGMGFPDGHMSDSLRNFLFLNQVTGKSLDLGALNIQRGRDHGLASYNDWRRHFGLAEFPANHTLEVEERIRTAYDDRVEEIDLFVGGLSETKEEGSLVGPLFGRLLAEQFSRLKFGDRYYYQNQPDGQSDAGLFDSEEQIFEIQKLCLARILCENTQTERIQKNIFMKPNENGNPMVDCSDYNQLPDIDFEKWRMA